MNDEAKLKTHDIILLVLIAMLCAFGFAAYFITPKDPENAKLVIGCIIASIGVVLTFKFTAHQAQVPSGTTQVTKTVSPPVAEPEARP